MDKECSKQKDNKLVQIVKCFERCLQASLENIKKYWLSYSAIALIIVIVTSYCLYIFKAEDKTISIVTNFIAFVFAFVGLIFFGKREKNQKKQTENQEKQIENQEKQIKSQIQQRINERFNDAIKLLGSNESSARTGAIYVFYRLAIDDDEKKYRRQIGQIICAYIQSKTQEKEYQKNNKKRPSNEIQNCIDLLFKPDKLYDKYKSDLDNADLSHAYLVGANFIGAKLQGAHFYSAKCQGAHFYSAKCQDANFFDVQLQGADFIGVQLQGANFRNASCQVAYFGNTHCQGANFCYAKLQGTYFGNTHCQGANFYNAKCQGTDFQNTNMEGACASERLSVNTTLKDRVGEKDELENMVFKGAIDEQTIAEIKAAKDYLGDEKYQKLQDIIKKNKGKKEDCAIPKNIWIARGVLEDSDEIQKIIREIDEVRKN